MFNCAVQTLTKMVWPQGYDLSATEAPDSLKKLKAEYAARKRITVFSGSSEHTIFADAGINQDFRAWHDYCHLTLNADFSLEGETAACNLQSLHIRQRYGEGETSAFMIQLLEAEVIGQALYYRRYKSYIDNQRAFVMDYIQNPEGALSRRY